MESEKKYGFQFRDNSIELSLQQLQTIIEMLDDRENFDYVFSLLQLWQDKFIEERKIATERNYQIQVEQERKREMGDD